MPRKIVISLLLFISLLTIPLHGASDNSNPPGRMVIAYLSLESKTADSDLSHWKYSMSEFLKKDIDKVKSIKMLSSNAVEYAFDQLNTEIGSEIDSGQARKIGELIEAHRVIYGNYDFKGGKWVVNIYVVNVATGDVSKKLSSASADLYDVRDEITKKIFGELKVLLTDKEQAKLLKRHTKSQKAIEARSRAYALSEQDHALSKVESELRLALSLDPQYVQLYIDLAVILATQGKLSEAQDFIDKAMKIAPDNAQLLVTAGHLYAAQKNFTKAKKVLQKSIQIDADCAEAQCLLGQVEMAQGNYHASIVYYELARQIDPFDAANLATMCLAYARYQKQDKAFSLLNEIERLAPKKGVAAGNVTQMLWRVYATLGDFPSAVKEIETNLRYLRSTGTRPDQLKRLEAIAGQLRDRLRPVYIDCPMPKIYNEKELQASLHKKLTSEEFKLVVDPLACTDKMEALAKEITKDAKTDLQKAKVIFDSMIARFVPASQTIGFGARNAQEVFAQWHTKEKVFICTELTNLYVALARSVGLNAFRVYVSKDYSGDSIYHMCAAVFVEDKVFLIDPSLKWFGIPHKEYVVLDDLRSIAYHLNQVKNMEKCRIALKLFPEEAIFNINMAGYLIDSGKFQQAQKILEKAMKLHPDHFGIYAQLSRSVAKQGKLGEAEKLCRKSLELNPKFSISHFTMGMILYEQKKLKEAREEFRESLLYMPDRNDAEAAHKNIAIINEIIGRFQVN